MVRLKTKQAIILKYYREGKSFRSIARELGVSRITITKYIKKYEGELLELNKTNTTEQPEIIESICSSPQYNADNRKKRKITEEIITIVKKYLEENKSKRASGQRKQQLKKIDIFELLQDLGFDIGYTSICNLINFLESKSHEAFIKQKYNLGEVCEFDWGEVKINTPDGLKTYQLAIFTTALGNFRYARLFKSQDTSSFQQAHALFINKVNGVYKLFVYDNMKVVVKKFVGLTEKEPTDGLLKLSMYYNFSFRFCNVRKGNEKGHVERSVEYVRRKAFAKRDRFDDLSDANQYLEEVCNKLNLKPQKENNNKTASEILSEEHAYLYPNKPFFECCENEMLKVDKYSTVSYKTCRYSVPDKYVGTMMVIRIYPDMIICYDENNKVSSHSRLHGAFEWSIKIEHYIKTLKRKPGALAGSMALDQANIHLKKIYKSYFKGREKEFVNLIEFYAKSSISIGKIQSAIEVLNPYKEKGVTLDKIKLLCNRAPEFKEASLPDNEIKQSCVMQISKINSIFFPDNDCIAVSKEVAL